MRIVTLNTWGTRGDWPARLKVFQDGFAELGADVITLQETILTGEVDQAAAMLGPGYHLAQQRVRERDGQGITTASRWPLGRVFEIDLHVTDRTHDFACACLVTEVLAGEPIGRLWVVNHLPDAWESIRPAERLGMYLPENPLSVDRDWPYRGIDHVLVRCDRYGPTLTIRHCDRIVDRGPISASDHYGLVVDLDVRPDPDW